MAEVQQTITTLQRTWNGLKVTVKIHPNLEEYFRLRGEV